MARIRDGTRGQQATCPFCRASHDSSAAATEDEASATTAAASPAATTVAVAGAAAGPYNAEGDTRQKRKMKKQRQGNRVGMWWKKYGYAGKPYCQVPEVHVLRIHRDHTPSEAGCRSLRAA
jgi:hypothetical protein